MATSTFCNICQLFHFFVYVLVVKGVYIPHWDHCGNLFSRFCTRSSADYLLTNKVY